MKSSMNRLCKRSLSVLVMVSLLISLLTMGVSAVTRPSTTKIVTDPTGYTKAEDVQYKTSGGKVANWGARGEDCLFLSTKAQSYYTGSYTFDTLSGKSGGSSQGNAPSSELYKALASMMRSKHSHQTSYNETRDLFKYTDCLKNDTSTISAFYSGTTFNSTWGTIVGGQPWNREHTWPNSKGLDGNDENDIMMLRPTTQSENSSRGNKAYGEGSGYSDPGPSVRGDCARIFLYVYVRWGNTNGNGQYSTWGSNGVMQNLDTLLRWMAEDPVDTWEMGRNDAVQSITGVRNVFVDYPEYAWLLFGRDVPSDVTTPSHNAGTSAKPNPDPGPTPDPNVKYATAVSTPDSGDTVYIYFASEGVALGSAASGTGMNAVTTELSGGKLAVTDDMLALTVSKDGNGCLTLRSPDGKYLTSAATGNGLSLESSQSQYSLWVLDSKGLKNVNAQYNGTAQYLEHYGSKGHITTYGYKDGSAGVYAVSFYTLETVSAPCSHGSTELRNKKAATCTESGYTGDTYCKLCGVKVSSGKATPASGHREETRNARQASCKEEGYTGDVYCTVCGAKLRSGEKTAKSAHMDYDGNKKCDTCGTEMSCAHGNKEIRNATTATCTTAGYSGDSYCLDCGAMLAKGQELPATGHQDADGNGQCDTCSTELGCTHENKEVRNATTATCADSGYSGDSYCLDCGTLLELGVEVPVLSHSGKLEGKVEATCGKEGYTGDTVCEACGKELEKGKTIPATGEHSFGDWLNTVDGGKMRTCSVCGERELQSETPEPGKTSVWVYIGAGVLGLAVLGGAGYGILFLIKKKKSEKNAEKQ